MTSPLPVVPSVTGVKAHHDPPTLRGGGAPRPPRSSSQGAGSPHRQPPKLVSQTSVSGGRLPRQRSLKHNNEDAVKRSRPHQSSYQLSQDLHDKQVGGAPRGLHHSSLCVLLLAVVLYPYRSLLSCLHCSRPPSCVQISLQR